MKTVPTKYFTVLEKQLFLTKISFIFMLICNGLIIIYK